MSLNRKFKACLITFILLVSSLSFLTIISSNVKAAGEGDTQTLYFTSYYITDTTDTGGEESLYPEMSPTRPTGDNDSLFPPNPFTNSEEWGLWFETWLVSKFPGMLGDDLSDGESIDDILKVYREELENQTDPVLSEEEINQTIEEYRQLLLSYGLGGDGESDLFNPFVMQEAYIYTGEKENHVTGTVTFDLYFSSNLPTKLLYNDDVKVAISVIDAESLTLEAKEIKNTTATIDPTLFGGKIQKQTISIEGVDFTLKNGDQMVFSIEMIPSEKPIGGFIGSRDQERILGIATLMANWLANQNFSSNLKEFGAMINESLNLILSGEDGMDLTVEDLAQIANTVRSSSFVFNSADHYSSVTLPFNLPGAETTSKTYYLSAGSALTETEPTNEKVTRAALKSGSSISWKGDTGFSRNKILTGASASLYIQHRDLLRLLNLPRKTVTLTLSFGDKSDDIKQITASTTLKRTTLLSILWPVKPTEIKFDFEPIEIPYGKELSLQISGGGTGLGLRSMVRLLYDSTNYKSSITLNFKDTDNINISADSSDQKIPAMGSAEYILNITSKYADTVSLSEFNTNKQGDWKLDYPESVEISGGYALVHVFANHTYEGDDPLETYDNDYITTTLVTTGKTGIARQDLSAEVSMDAIDYNVYVKVPSGKEIKHGESKTYTFTIKNNNTGLISDSYDIVATSEHEWNVEISDYDGMNIQAGDEFNVDVTVYVPEFTDLSSDLLTLTITSIESDVVTTINVTTTVVLPNILEHIYNFFASSAESIGLDEVLGDYAGAFLIFIIIFIIMIFLVIIIYLLRIKYVEIICFDRIKEIEPEGQAEFEINIHNPRKDTLSYKISAEMDPTSEGWEATVDTTDMTLGPKESKPMKLIVKPNDYVKTEGWVEVKVVAENIEKGKVAKISTVTNIKNATPELRISGVFHWPTVFKKGDKVVTSFRVQNDGKASASNVTITLFVNGEAKNKAENITIPRGGYAEIEMPWIAVKGKNEVNIVVK